MYLKLCEFCCVLHCTVDKSRFSDDGDEVFDDDFDKMVDGSVSKFFSSFLVIFSGSLLSLSMYWFSVGKHIRIDHI